jgi:hypothetical protein
MALNRWAKDRFDFSSLGRLLDCQNLRLFNARGAAQVGFVQILLIKSFSGSDQENYGPCRRSSEF